MNKQLITGILVLSLTLGMVTVAGCTNTTPKEDINVNVPPGAPALMPETHEGRFESLGAAGCYGCHGANEKANPMLTGSAAMPDEHYVGEQPNARTLDPTHDQCNTCHVQG